MDVPLWRRSLVAVLSALLVLEAGAFASAASVSAASAPSVPAAPDQSYADGSAAPTEAHEPVEASAPAPVELVDERTASSRTLDNGDGTFTTELLTDPIFYRPGGAADADWQPIEVGFDPIDGARPDSDLVAASTMAPVQVSIGANKRSDGRFGIYTQMGRIVSFGPR